MAKKKRVTSGFWLDQRRKKIDGTYPVKIRVTYNRQNRFYDSGWSVNIDTNVKKARGKEVNDFTRLQDGRNLPERLIKMERDLRAQIEKAERIGNNLKPFTWDQFKKEYVKDETTHPENLIKILERYRDELRSSGRIGSAVTYQNTVQALINFQSYKNKKNPFYLNYIDCSKGYLKDFEEWLISKKGNSVTTVGYHCRNIRRAWRIGIEENEFDRNLYPFGEGKFEIPNGPGNKRFLGEKDLQRLFEYNPSDEKRINRKSDSFYYDLWFLSYFMAGANLKDICKLQFKNLRTEETNGEIHFKLIEFERAKTKRSKKDADTIKIPLTGPNQEMVERIIKKHWSGENNKPSAYIFPILKEGMSPEEESKTIRQFTKSLNQRMKKIGDELGISLKITSYVARHSFASMALIKQVAPMKIRQLMGHSSIQTTERYLSGFPDEIIGEALESIIPNSTKKQPDHADQES